MWHVASARATLVHQGPKVQGVLLEAWRAPKEHATLPIPKVFSSCSLQGPKHLAECELGVGRGAGS